MRIGDAMLRVLRQALMSPVTGPIATAVAIALAVALGVNQADWESRRLRYEARILQLSLAAAQTQSSLRDEIAACHAAGRAGQAPDTKVAVADGTPDGARRLLEHGPAEIDACARMESADHAVLSNLKR